MTVYIVQKRYWHFNDDIYRLDDCYPVKAFESREDAEIYCEERHQEALREWEPQTAWMLTEEGPAPVTGVDMFEVVEMEIDE